MSGLRTVSHDVFSKEVLPKDSVPILVVAVAYFSVFDAMLAAREVEIGRTATNLLVVSTLKIMMGVCCIRVERVEVKDVKLPI